LKNDYQLTVPDLVSYIDKTGELPITQQTKLLGIARSDYYYQPAPVSPVNVAVMDKIDEIYTKRPYYGSRKMAKEVSELLGYRINRKRVQRLMQIMGIEAIYPKPNLSSNPKDKGVSGLHVSGLFSQGKIREIGDYVSRDVISTAQLYDTWKKYMAGKIVL